VLSYLSECIYMYLASQLKGILRSDRVTHIKGNFSKACFFSCCLRVYGIAIYRVVPKYVFYRLAISLKLVSHLMISDKR